MGFFKKLATILSPQSKPEEWVTWIELKCNRCGEIIRGRVDLRNDLSIEYGDNDADTRYFCRKILIGSGKCYNPVEVELTFDRSHKLIHKSAHGGQFVTPPPG